MTHGFWLGPWFIDTLQQAAVRGMERVALSANEAGILAYLREHSAAPVSRETLLVEVFQYAPGVKSRAVDMGLSRLRRKLEKDPKKPELVKARRGLGVFLEQLGEEPPSRPADPPPPGRASAAQKLGEVLNRGALATLTGPSGIGKSTLARHMAQTRSGRLVGLVNQTDSLGMQSAVASVLQCSIASIEERLDGLQLLVLDNFEQLDEASARCVQEWSALCPILVTSVRPLRIAAEEVVVLPELEPEVAAGVLQEQARRAGVAASPEDAQRLVELVGGHPLALVLLAPSIGLLDDLEPELLLQLDSDRPDHPTRHRSLQSALDRAIALTSPAARQTLADLSIFALQFEPHAVKAVCGAAGLLALRELTRWGLVQQTDGTLQLPPIIALHARQLPRSEGLQERFWSFLLSIRERLYVQGEPIGSSPYIEDVLTGLSTIDDQRVYALAQLASQLKAPQDRFSQLLAARPRPVAHDDSFTALQVIADFGSPLRNQVMKMERSSAIIALVQEAIRFDEPNKPPLSLEEYRSLRPIHPEDWANDVVGLAYYLQPADAIEALEEEIATSRSRGWSEHVDHLRASQAQAHFQIGEHQRAFTTLRDIDGDRLTMTARIYLVASCAVLGLFGLAQTSARQLLASSERGGWPHDVYRARVLIAVTAYLSGEPALAKAQEALRSPGGTNSPRWGQLAMLVQRLETGSTQPVGHAEIDQALAGGPLPADPRTISTLAKLMFLHSGKQA